jgi:hypothetical protein
MLGKRETVLIRGHSGFLYFPDEPMSILSSSPSLRVYIVAGPYYFYLAPR